ncbi:uncharacterized protein isoform X2 [Choristoneura fumiferana]|uniref:uncharacterized protein isoform X5 n=1 Tax=Choristoneura fumiferana TaxID=7141 RepID=UPI003D157501
MEPRTSRKDYKNHHYSGPRKNRKRVQGQMKRYHGEIKSRNEVWCKKRKMDDDPNINSSSASRANCGFVKCKNVTSSDIFLQHMI